MTDEELLDDCAAVVGADTPEDRAAVAALIARLRALPDLPTPAGSNDALDRAIARRRLWRRVIRYALGAMALVGLAALCVYLCFR